MQSSSTGYTLRVAVLDALRTKGAEVLHAPRELVKHVRAVADQASPYVALFQSNCDLELLDPFALAVAGDDAKDVEDAARRAESLLVQKRFAREEAAHKVCCELAFALATFMGVQVSPQIVRDAVAGEGYVMTPSVVTPLNRGFVSMHSEKVPSVDSSSQPIVTPQTVAYGHRGWSKTRTAVTYFFIALAVFVGTYAGLSVLFEPPTWLSLDEETSVEADLVGTWYPESIDTLDARFVSYKERSLFAQQGELQLMRDHTYTTEFYPDSFTGEWKLEEGELELLPGTDGDYHMRKEQWGTDSCYGVIENEKLIMTYPIGKNADGEYIVVYGKDDPRDVTSNLVGMWEIVEWCEKGEVRYGEEVFEGFRNNNLYSIYLDVREDNTIEWDNQGQKRSGTWKATSQDEGFVHIDAPKKSKKKDDAFWEGIIELKGENLVFHFHGEEYYQVFRRIDSDPRESGTLKKYTEA
ncbi:MAG: lipocalin family protein [Atopobiaceae bacterium]|nr:lipocalin family protein [Atopobiaceae bacterium]